MTGVAAVERNVYDGADAAAGDDIYTQPGHKLFVSCCDAHSVNLGDNALTGQLLNVPYALPVKLFTAGAPEAQTDRM